METPFTYWARTLALVGFGFEDDERSMIHLFGNGVLVRYENMIWLLSCQQFFREETNGYPFKIVFAGDEVSHSVVLRRDFIKKNARVFSDRNLIMIPVAKVDSAKPWTGTIPGLFNWYPPRTPFSNSAKWYFVTRPVSKIKPAAAFNPSSLKQTASYEAEFLATRQSLQSEEHSLLNDINILRPLSSNFELPVDCAQEESDGLQYYLSGYLGGLILTGYTEGKIVPAGIISGTGITTLQDTDTGSSNKSGILLFNKLSSTLVNGGAGAIKD